MTDWAKYISKYAGISGVKAGHIVKQIESQGLDPASFDWLTIGSESKDYGDQYSTIWKKLGAEYGVTKPDTIQSIDFSEKSYLRSLERDDDEIALGNDLQFEICMNRHKRRTRNARAIDERIHAKNTFQMNDTKGVQLWMKQPNMYDIIGIDNFQMNTPFKKNNKKRK